MIAPSQRRTLAPVLTAAAMREADRFTIEDYGVPGFTLMETAGRGAADWIEEVLGPVAGKTVACFCGKGNNGGDGFVVARVLHARGARVRVVALGAPGAMSDDAAHNWRLLERLAEQHGDITLVRFESLIQLAAFRPADIHVDALLGTGLTSDLREPILGLVDWLNEQPQPMVALDVPTGLHSDYGHPLGTAIRADLTVTMGALKTGLLLHDGPALAGRTETVEIGIPRFVLEQVLTQTEGCAWHASDATIRAWLPERRHDANKYSAGLVLVVAGAPGMTGAPVMASQAAYRAGAGFVTCACHEGIQAVLGNKLTEVTTLALPGAQGGGIDPEAALEAMQDRLAKAKALLVGPGLGQHPGTRQFVRALLRKTDLPTVIDADGLNALADDPDFLARHAAGRWILTPHAGEFARLAGDVSLDDRVRVVQDFAQRWNGVFILKGLPSIVAGPDGTTFINRTGNAALATAGTGDVLAGMSAGLLAQGLPPLQAALAALHLGGAAADQYAATRHPNTMQATDLLTLLPTIMHERFR